MASVNMTQGLKVVGDRASGVAGAGGAMAGMGFDDNTHTFLNTDTACNTQGASPHFQGLALDQTPTGGSAATPYVVNHQATLAAGSAYNGNTIKRVSLHNTNAPTDSTTDLMFGIDGLSLVKASSFSLATVFQLSYT